MWNEPSKERLEQIPKLYETENILLKDKLIYLHFFLGNCDFFIAEFDGEELFWGFAILNNDFEMAEWGYISYEELKSIKVGWQEIDCDLHWRIRTASEVDKICEAQRWPITRKRNR